MASHAPNRAYRRWRRRRRVNFQPNGSSELSRRAAGRRVSLVRVSSLLGQDTPNTDARRRSSSKSFARLVLCARPHAGNPAVCRHTTPDPRADSFPQCIDRSIHHRSRDRDRAVVRRLRTTEDRPRSQQGSKKALTQAAARSKKPKKGRRGPGRAMQHAPVRGRTLPGTLGAAALTFP